ncbi:hypothetical protein ACJDU8_21070 [Clostridium sp. WILCCON 0269]|uniref:Uncharacterized protein n=1 Tax=Candidatus Clostridium eludens TaxID=3381663 RepID=A0ABW8SPN3_9CLOT
MTQILNDVIIKLDSITYDNLKGKVYCFEFILRSLSNMNQMF